MIDIKFLRENPDVVKENIKKKFQDHKLPLVDEVIELDAQARKTQQEADNLRAERNKLSKQIGALMAQGKKEEAEEVKKQVNAEAQKLEELAEQEKELNEKVTKIMMTIPNIIDPSVPIGKNDMYIRNISSGSTAGVFTADTGWKKVCTTSVADVGKTNITSINTDINLGSSSYVVNKGVAYVSIWELTASNTGKAIMVATSMPKTYLRGVGAPIIDMNDNCTVIGCVYMNTYDPTKLYVNMKTTGVAGYCSFSYPVAE